jgi:hypothetical protein
MTTLKDLTNDQLITYYNLYNKLNKRHIDSRSHGHDVKFLYHVVRLLDECKMVLEEHDLDLTRSKEYLKSIRRGELSVEQIVEYFDTSMKYLDTLYTTSTLRYAPDEDVMKQLLIDCIEMHYGDISNAFDNKKNVDKNIIRAYNLLSKVVNNL